MTTTTPRTTIQGEPDPWSPPPQPAHAPPRRHPARVTAAVLCVLLGGGLVGGAAVTTWADHRAANRPLPSDAAYRKAESLWRAAPVDSLLPPVLTGPRPAPAAPTGPGPASRSRPTPTVRPPSPPTGRPCWPTCGCTRVLRATYTDATRSSLITVGLVFTPADVPAMTALTGRITAPPAYGFTDGQRAAWAASVLDEAPVVVYTVSSFADGRPLDAPRPAGDLMKKDATGAVAQAGLGHEAKALADRIGQGVAALAAPPVTPAPEATR